MTGTVMAGELCMVLETLHTLDLRPSGDRDPPPTPASPGRWNPPPPPPS